MNMLYSFFLYAHIFSAILSLGPFFVLLPIVKKLKTANSVAFDALLSPFFISVQIAKHAGHVLIVTGVFLVLLGTWSFFTSWVVLTIIILIGSTSFLAHAFTPTLKKLRNGNADHLLKLLNRAIWIYIILLMVMLYLMVEKPMFW